MHKRIVQFCGVVMTLALLMSSLAAPVGAKTFFTARRTFGVLFLGGSVIMAKKALDFRQDANDIYDAYRIARTAQEAQRLFDRASDRDTKSQMSLGVSVVLLASGLRLLLFSGVDDNIPKMDRGLGEMGTAASEPRNLRVELTGDARSQAVGIAIKRSF